jgi:hypothetical protein
MLAVWRPNGNAGPGIGAVGASARRDGRGGARAVVHCIPSVVWHVLSPTPITRRRRLSLHSGHQLRPA